MRHRAWGLLLVVPAALWALVAWTSPVGVFHQHLVFAGTPDRFAHVVAHAGRADVRGAIWLDNVFVVSWLLLVPRLLRCGLDRWCPDRRRRFGPWGIMPRLAVAPVVLDGVENVVSLFLAGKPSPPTALTILVGVVGWSKWVLYLASLAGLAALVVGPAIAPVVRPAMRRLFGVLDRAAGSHPTVRESIQHAPDSATMPVDSLDERIGICVSGGGIRAASVAIGALRGLDRPVDGAPSLFRRASWLTAVSGGAYTAGGWRIGRRPDGKLRPLPTDARDGLFDATHPWAQTVRLRRRFLDNGAASIAGGVANALFRTVAVLGGVFGLTYVVAWATGQAVRTIAMHAWFPFTGPSQDQRLAFGDLFPLRLVAPGAAWIAVGALVVLVSFTRPDPIRRARAQRLGLPMIVTGLVLAVLMVGIPVALVEVPKAFRRLPGDGADEGAGILGALTSLGVIGAVVGVVIAQVKRRWLRLGGVLLAILVVLFGWHVATVIAFQRGGPWSNWDLGVRIPVVAVAVAWVVALDCVASHRLTLGGLYRKRLAATFALADGSSPPLDPLAYSDEPLWPAYASASGPELIVAATAHSSTTTFSGMKGYGFTFRPDRVSLFDRTDGTSAAAPMTAYPTGSWWDGFPRGWLISRSMALTGGAFASAMGRQALGTTQALLVALNLRLGAWVPNPRFTEWFADPATSPRVHAGYLLKELFGRYDPTEDAFVYVADGGHRENLGLVELLREHPRVVCCVDASGDRPGTFQTLREAMELATVELGVDVDIDLARLRSTDGALPLDCAATGTIRYPASMGGDVGTIIYGRYQLSEIAPPELLQFRGTHPKFPSYSTADQYLDEDEHLQLVALGEHVAERILGLFEDRRNSIGTRV